MKLHAVCTIRVSAISDCPVVAMLRPRSGQAQWMMQERYALDPWVPVTEYVDSFGNLCQRMTIPRGDMCIEVEMVMVTEDATAVDPEAAFVPIDQLPCDTLQYLLQSRYCPSDKMLEHAQHIAANAPTGYAQVEAIRSWIHDNLTYRYGTSNETTDALDTLKDRAGVCRDFAHVGIALCRALRIPARFVVGYLHELEPMDMHAWFEAFLGGRWYTFDATQACARGGRIVVAYGRDAADVAFISNYGPLEVGEMKVTVSEVPPAERP